MAKISRTPWLGSFTLNDAAAHRLSDILTDTTYVALANQPSFASVPRCQYLALGNDVGNAGLYLYLGNENLTSTFYGERLVAGMSVPIYSMDSNLIRLDQIYVLASGSGLVVTVKLLTR